VKVVHILWLSFFVGDPCVVFVVLISVVGFVGNCCLWICVVFTSILFVFSRLLVEEDAFL
jgi:hypothetical protein